MAGLDEGRYWTIIETLIQLDEENMLYSFHNTEQPLYKKLIDFGKPAIPILLEYLRTEEENWWAIIALTELTGENPMKSQNCGKIKKLTQDWLEWDKQGQPHVNRCDNCDKHILTEQEWYELDKFLLADKEMGQGFGGASVEDQDACLCKEE